ncbi:hypothetical protein [Herbaspirillum sp. CF444]|uniref:hypothetical protein n=1 Tax=Herbaspirillum sp. CF444 TaxID=1144319 RepID=UPI0012F868F5|nr:hypothetical protein [Herbaspirillum sp. CF444]
MAIDLYLAGILLILSRDSGLPFRGLIRRNGWAGFCYLSIYHQCFLHMWRSCHRIRFLLVFMDMKGCSAKSPKHPGGSVAEGRFGWLLMFVFGSIALMGAGRFSIDAALSRKAGA